MRGEVERLYVIGNGFDLHHRLPTSFGNFQKYVHVNDSAVYDAIEEHLPISEGWADLEAAFGKLDVDYLVESKSHFMASYSSDDWSDSGHHDFQYEVGETVSAISDSLLTLFCKWLKTIDLNNAKNSDSLLLPLDETSSFLSFNYTDTLQEIYGISDTQILHIHGRIADPSSEIVLGHAWRPDMSTISREYGPEEEQDTRLVEGLGIVEKYFKSTFKQTDKIIASCEQFFDGLDSVEEIFILGHSLADVDLPYFQKLIDVVDSNCRYIASYYSESERVRHKKVLNKLGLPNPEFVKLSEIDHLN